MRLVLILAGLMVGLPTHALDNSVTRINGDDSRTLLGDGTGVVIGVVDSGVDDLHPDLVGTDSLGNTRMVAEANFVTLTAELSNTGDDVANHGTPVAGTILGNGSTYTGMAPDARFVNARVLSNTNGFSGSSQVVNGAGFALGQGADIINMSLGYSNWNQSGNSTLSKMADAISYQYRIPVTVSAGNNGTNSLSGDPDPHPQGPGDAFNVFSTAATQSSGNYGRIVNFSSYGPTADGRIRPVITAPGQNITMPSANWEGGSNDYTSKNGTSFAAPHVAGLLAQQIEYGRANSMSIDPLVLRSTVMNSAEKVLNRNGGAWAPNAAGDVSGVYTATQSLDAYSGTGQIDGLALYEQYSAGMQGPGNVGAVGWDLNTITGVSSTDYFVDAPLTLGTTLAATLVWDRHVTHTDTDGNGLDAGDPFTTIATLDNLDLTILLDGTPIATAVSTVDNIEHLFWNVTAVGDYSIRVTRQNVAGSGGDELFSLAWLGTESEAGDADQDGDVDTTDLQLLAQNWQDDQAVWGMGDFNGDGDVDALDLGLMVNHWGLGVTGTVTPINQALASVGLIPEPATLLVMLFGATLMAQRPRHRTRFAA